MWFRASRGAMTGTSEFNSSLKVTARCPRSFHRGGRVEVDDLALHSWARDRRRSSAKLLETSEIPHILYIYIHTYYISMNYLRIILFIIYANISVFLSFLQLCLVVLLLKSPLLAAGDPPATGPFAAWQRWLSNLGWT